MRCITGEELIALAGTSAAVIAQCMSIEELIELCELLGLLKFDLEVIKSRRILNQKMCEKLDKT